jgi:hypothetical protein
MTTGVMAAPGVAWLPLCQMLEARGFAVALGQARHVPHGPGRPQTERCDCRWLPKWTTDGFLAPSCRPPEARCRLRSLLRHQEHLSRMTVQPRQTSLAPMPLPLPQVMRARTGGTGRRLLRAIVAGDRAPRPCAPFRDSRIQSRARLWPKHGRAMTAPTRAAHAPHPLHSLPCPSSPWRPAIRPWRVPSAPAMPGALLTRHLSPHRRPPLGNPSVTSRPLLAVPRSPGSLASPSRQGRGATPPRSPSSASRWASRGLHGRRTSRVPPGEAAVPRTRCGAAQSSLPAGGGSTSGPGALCAWLPKVSARVPALSERLSAACAAHWGQRQRRRPRPTHWRKGALPGCRSQHRSGNAGPSMTCPQRQNAPSDQDASQPSPGDALCGLRPTRDTRASRTRMPSLKPLPL